MRSKVLPIIIGLLFSLAIFTGGYIYDDKERGRIEQEQRHLVHEHALSVLAVTEDELHKRFVLTAGLSAFVKSQPDPQNIATKDFEIFAKSLIGDTKGIRSIQLAQNVIVSHVYPYKGNEAAVGHDLLADPARREAAQKAIEMKNLVVAGPVELKQGGTGLIGRMPIYLNEDGDGNQVETLWGLAIVLLDYDTIISDIGIKETLGPINYALRGTDAKGAQGSVFFGNEKVFSNDPILLEITLPYGSWQLGVAPLQDWSSLNPSRTSFRILIFGLGVIVGVLIWFMLRIPRRLEEEITRATNLLKQSEDRYAAILGNSPASTILTSKDGSLVMVNPAFCKLIGFDEKELIGNKFIDWSISSSISADSMQRYLEGFNKAKPSNAENKTMASQIEASITTKNGQRRSVQYSEYFLFDDNDEPQFKVTLINDITEQKLAQLKVIEEQNKAQEYLDVAAVIITALDNSGQLLMMNSKGLDITGYSADEIIGKNFIDTLIPEQDRDEFRKNLGRALNSPLKDLSQYTYSSIITKELIIRQIKWRFTKLSASESSETGEILASGEDVTDIRQAEIETQQLLQAIEQAAESITIMSPAGELRYVNPAFEKSTGYSKQEIIGNNITLLNSDRHTDEFYSAIWQQLEQGNVWNGFLFNKRKNGSIFEEETMISPVKDVDGSIISYIGVGRDVTYEKQIEEQLLQSQKLEAIGRLAGGIAHDFNNQLTAINGYADLILLKVPEGEVHEDILEIIKAGQRAAVLTAQLLAFSRKQTQNIKSLNLNKIISETQNMLQRLIGESIALKTELDPNVKCIKADPNQIEQMIFNLIINSRDAMPAGGDITIETGSVHLDAERLRGYPNFDPGHYVMLAVNDSGIGMDDDTKAHLFEPFFTTKDVGKGTGLGLSTVYGIVEQSGGFIKLRSEINEGTSFRIYFKPCDEEVCADIVAPVAQKDLPKGSERILLAEDDNSVRELATTILKRQGYLVVSASSGIEARNMVDQKPELLGQISLLVTDVVMPEMNGKELVEKLRDIRPGLKVIFISGFTADIISPSGVLDDLTIFLQKPFSAADLSNAVRELLDK